MESERNEEARTTENKEEVKKELFVEDSDYVIRVSAYPRKKGYKGMGMTMTLSEHEYKNNADFKQLIDFKIKCLKKEAYKYFGIS